MDTPKGRLKGRLLDVADGPVLLEAQSCFHCTLPWEGRRLVLVAYVVAGLERFSSEHRSVVSGLGFELPVLASGAGTRRQRFILRCQINSQASP